MSCCFVLEGVRELHKEAQTFRLQRPLVLYHVVTIGLVKECVVKDLMMYPVISRPLLELHLLNIALLRRCVSCLDLFERSRLCVFVQLLCDFSFLIQSTLCNINTDAPMYNCWTSSQ